ncbi:DNA cytosine methyltransferase [Brucellaceae bacterium C25G]
MGNRFIDLFAGCGGLSLGLKQAGWQGVFAIERTPDAFSTLKHNLIDGDVVNSFEWPSWLPCEAMTTSDLINKYTSNLEKLRGTIDLIAGGPPCQGFSFAGRRNPNDPRNRLTEEYIQIVKLLEPKYLLLENVKGFKAAFKQNGSENGAAYSDIVQSKLSSIGYTVYHRILNASDFGVPQPRPRFIMIAIKNGLNFDECPFAALEIFRPLYLKNKGLSVAKPTTLSEAISDLEIVRNGLTICSDSPGFNQIDYKPGKLTKYQKLMRLKSSKVSAPNSLRLAKHKAETLAKFNYILETFEKGKSLKKSEMEALGTKKQNFTPLHPNMLSRTITTLPDDLLHYSEPRILTVRENARIQSFPDWFEFTGKYTTGGARRKEECPRYTQVGNAVPPLLAEALGLSLLRMSQT